MGHVLQDLRQLVYPAAQLLLGALRLVPSPTWFPLHLRLLGALQGLSAATGLYIPLAQPLLHFLQWPGLRKCAQASQMALTSLQRAAHAPALPAPGLHPDATCRLLHLQPV